MKGTLADFAPDLVSSAQMRRAVDLARALYTQLELDQALSPFRREVFGAECPPGGPTLHLEDVSDIPFVCDVPGVAEYQHRARVRATTGDLFAAASAPVAGYEAYCQQHLGLGAPEFVSTGDLSAKGGRTSMTVAADLGEAGPLEALTEWMGANHGLTIHPYMAIESVWALARNLNQRAAGRFPGARARVLGPPPPVLWVANDKASLTDIIERVSDGAWNVETRIEVEPARMARALQELAKRHPRVGLKRTRCASAMGNIVFASAALEQARPDQVEAMVAKFLEKTQWEDAEPVLVVEWADACDSPSTQMWIPPLPASPSQDAGAPGPAAGIRLDGIFQQILDGEQGVFVGSRPSTLGAPVEQKLAEISFVMAVIFQQLGYVGRCSFDFILTGDPDSDAPEDWDARMIECNGRWGGTSTPMHLVDRLTSGPRPAYLAQDFVHPDLVGAKFSDLLAACGPDLFDPATGQGRFILYNCGPLVGSGKFDVISIAASPQEALEGVQSILPKNLALN